jgi:uncharacterized protein
MTEAISQAQRNAIEQKMMALNALTRSISTMFPGYFGGDTKHPNFYADYGYPTALSFDNYHQAWERNGLAKAGIERPIETCWQEFPRLVELEDTHDKTPLEIEIAKAFEGLQFWSNLSEADKYSRVGEYSGVIFRFRDGKSFDQPVETVSGGIEGLAEIIPAWQGQLTADAFYQDQSKENYGQVSMYTFNESAVKTANGKTQVRQMQVHPDRVHIWSRNSTIWGVPALKGGWNDLLTCQKIIGAGGEGFWKIAKAAPMLEIEKEANLNQLATMLGTTLANLPDKLDEIIGDYQKGFDKMLMLQGMKASQQTITMPDPKEFMNNALMSYAASLSIPLKILVGSQTGERASTEDAKEWNKTCNSRRTNYIRPNIMRIVARLVKYKILPEKDWYLLWGDLTESTTAEKIGLAKTMADIQKVYEGSGQQVFTPDEVRETAGWAQAIAEPIIPKRVTQTSNSSD